MGAMRATSNRFPELFRRSGRGLKHANGKQGAALDVPEEAWKVCRSTQTRLGGLSPIVQGFGAGGIRREQGLASSSPK